MIFGYVLVSADCCTNVKHKSGSVALVITDIPDISAVGYLDAATGTTNCLSVVYLYDVEPLALWNTRCPTDVCTL